MSTTAGVPASPPAVAVRGVLLLATALALLLLRPVPAHADVVELTPPPDGCLAFDAAAIGMDDPSVQTVELELEGPVVQVVIEWGGLWQPPNPLDPAIGLEVTGPGGTLSGEYPGTGAHDPTGLSGSVAHGYFADVTELFGAAGTYTVAITPPPDTAPGSFNRWGGATVTAVYDSSPCDDVAMVIWKTGADFYFGDSPDASPTTETVVYDWGYPLAEDYVATFNTSHAGADHLTEDCRVSAIWVATGDGAAPAAGDDLVDDAGVANPAYGAVEGIVSPFTPPNQPCTTTIAAPVESVSGGNVGPEWALVQFEVRIPAGSTWAAFQLESPADNGGLPGQPESGAWNGAGLLILPAFVPPVPAIALEKTVLDGAGATCPGVEGTDELVTGANGTPVTYCFRVVNTGEVPLFPVEIDDPDLGITDAAMTLVSGDDTVALQPGEELVYSYESTITADLLNTATVTGQPPDGDPVTDTNDASVELVPPNPDIALEKTVLAGAAATCPGVEGTDELVTGEDGTPVTYCFRVVNTGGVPLFPVEIDDPDLGITHAAMTLVSGDDTVPLAPGEELVYSYESTITADLVNTATVTGQPTDDGDPVTDTNDAAVEVLPPVPAVALEKTVLDGAGATCPGVEGTDELVGGDPGAPVTYCFRVVNTGDLPLFPVEIDDPDLGITDADMTLVSGDDTVPLQPGEELVYSYESTITADLLNTASVTGQPPDDGEPVTDTNDASVLLYTLDATVVPFCAADTPYLGYDISTNGPFTTATITFSDGDDSESFVVDVGTGALLWPGARVDLEGNPTDWPGWDQDSDGDWFLNPDNPYAWARGDVDVTVTVNPTVGPVTVAYPPAEPTCSAAPPPNQPPPPGTPPRLVDTGTPAGSQASLAALMVAAGLALVAASRRLRTRA